MGEWNKNNVGIVVCTLPHKRKPTLFVKRGDKIAPVATFNNKDDAEVFEVYMAHLTGQKNDGN